MVHRGDLDDDGEVSTGLDRDGHDGDLDTEDLHVLVVHTHTVVDLLGVPQLEVDDEVDLKKAAKLAGCKSVSMIHVKDLLNVTGYIRGGCSPIGMKKQYRTFIDEMIELVDDVCVSAGQRGVQLRLKSSDLISFTNAVVGDFAMRS